MLTNFNFALLFHSYCYDYYIKFTLIELICANTSHKCNCMFKEPLKLTFIY